MSKWTAANAPDQHGRVAIVTGANSGLGFETTLALARKGARVVMACRNLEKGEAALARLKMAVPGADVDLCRLNLADQTQIRSFSADILDHYGRLDILINNAGIMAIPRWETTDGFEVQFGVNHLGHFALTGLLLPLLKKTPGSRVVTVSSMMAWAGRIDFDDLQRKASYTRYSAYSQSKLANVLFGLELDRRLQAAKLPVASMVAHPGYSATNLQETSSRSSNAPLEGALYGLLNKVAAQSAVMGALPQLYAATSPRAKHGCFYGPKNFARGYPAFIKPPKAALDGQTARRLWAESQNLTNLVYSWENGSAAVSTPLST
jgi:NAD(P)-dependent dehydrogenase (short-subunit alcohol dehydrogenase family)